MACGSSSLATTRLGSAVFSLLINEVGFPSGGEGGGCFQSRAAPQLSASGTTCLSSLEACQEPDSARTGHVISWVTFLRK